MRRWYWLWLWVCTSWFLSNFEKLRAEIETFAMLMGSKFEKSLWLWVDFRKYSIFAMIMGVLFRKNAMIMGRLSTFLPWLWVWDCRRRPPSGKWIACPPPGGAIFLVVDSRLAVLAQNDRQIYPKREYIDVIGLIFLVQLLKVTNMIDFQLLIIRFTPFSGLSF
jgi:hypothetical protein